MRAFMHENPQNRRHIIHGLVHSLYLVSDLCICESSVALRGRFSGCLILINYLVFCFLFRFTLIKYITISPCSLKSL